METREDWKQRVREEREVLMERLGKLTAYLDGEVTATTEDLRLLQEQQRAMRAYADVLRQRIARF